MVANAHGGRDMARERVNAARLWHETMWTIYRPQT